MDVVYPHVAGVDVHKKKVTVTVRTPDPRGSGRRWETTRTFRTFYGELLEMARWLVEDRGVEQVAMESTGVYWWPVYQALKEVGGQSLNVEVCNAAHVKAVPGRKTDVKDAAWLAQLMEVGLLKGSFIPPQEVRQLRDWTRYRTKLVEERTRQKQRLLKVLETAGIKLDSVASDSFGVSGRDMLDALVAGQRDPVVLAQLARGRLRSKLAELRLALQGRFNDHHAQLVKVHLDQIDHLGQVITQVEDKIGRLGGGPGQAGGMIAAFEVQMRLLMTIPGIGERTAAVVISEIGVDMSRFPSPGHLAAWAGLAPGNNESAGKHRRAKRRKGNTHVCSILVEAAWAASRTRSRVSGRFHHLFRRFGGRRNRQAGPKSAFAVAHTIIKIIWKVLSTGTGYEDLGVDYYTRPVDPHTEARKLATRIEQLTGRKVILTNPEPPPPDPDPPPVPAT